MRRLAFLAVLGLSVLASANEKGEALLKQIDAVKMPTWVQDKENDKTFMDKYMKEIAVARKQKNDLILNLYKEDPSNPRTLPLMRERWISFEAGNIGDGKAYAQRVSADIDKVLADKPTPAIQELGESMKIMVQIDNQWNWNGALSAIEGFIKKYPKSAEGPGLLLSASYSAPAESRRPYYQKLVEAFPDSKYAAMAKGALRQYDAIGRPFELKFKDAISGKPFDMADQKGKVVVVDFWATWCGPCVAKMPEVKKVLQTYGPKGLEVVGVSLDQPEKEGGLKKLKEFVAKNQYPWPQYYQGNGWDSEFSSSWGIMSIPNVFVIDRKGNLREIGVSDLEATVKKLLAEQP